MITEPSRYDATKRSGTASRFIISLTDGTTTWLIGNFDGAFTDGRIIYLINDYTFSQVVDEDSKMGSRASMTLDISNLPYKYVNGTAVRLADEIGNVIGLYEDKPAKLYKTADPDTTSLSDCLNDFNGVVRSISTNGDSLTITLEDRGYVIDTVLTDTKVKEVL